MKLPRSLMVPAIVLALSLLTWLPSSAASGSGEPISNSDSAALSAESSAIAMQRKKTVQITFQVKGPDRNPVGGARVNVWHDTWGPDTGPPDYQAETHGNGRVTIEVLANKTSEVTVEVSKGDLWYTENLKLAGTKIFRFAELKKLTPGIFSVDESRLINVRVHVVDEKGAPVEGAKVIFGDNGSGSRQIEAEGATDQKGEVTIGVRAWNYMIYASKDGYQEGKVALSLTTYERGKLITAPTLRLIKKTAVEAVEVVVQVQNAGDRNGVSGAQVVLTGQAGITSGVYSGTTNSSGEVRIRLKEYGKFNLEISQEHFEPFTGEVRIAYGETQKNLPTYVLKEKPKKSEGSDLVSVNVLAGDKNRAPIAGASVLVERTTVATDASGLASVSNVIGLEATSVAVTVTAPGYKRQTRMVPVRRGVQYTNASATATFVLEPGEDPASADTPIPLVVEIIDSFTDQPLSKTEVRIRFKGRIVGIENTNEFGEARFELKDTATMSVAEFRSGLKIDAYHDNYLPRDSDITPDRLTPSRDPRVVTLHLHRDWTALGKAIGLLEGKVAAWNNDGKELSAKVTSVRNLAEQIRLVDKRISAIAADLSAFRAQVTGVNGPGTEPRCHIAAQLRRNIELYEAQAGQKAQEVAEKINAATAIAEKCLTAGDGAAIKRYHQDAIRLAAEIGRLDKQAGEASRKLSGLAKETEALRQTLKEAEDRVLRIDVEVRTAETLARQINADYERGASLRKDLDNRRDALAPEINDLKKIHGLDPRFINRLPPDLKKRLDDLASLLASRNSDVFSAPDKAALDAALLLLPDIRAAKAGAEKMLAGFRSAQCDIDPMSDRVRVINEALLSASADLSLAADLPQKADDCARHGACQPLLTNIGALLEEDKLESAAAKINEARAKGCDVRKAAEDLEYFRTVRQTANLLAESLENCRYQQALNLAQQIPASIKSRPLVAQALAAVQRGLQAQKRIAQLRASAKLAVERTRQRASANSYIEEAQMAADGFPCLIEEVNQFRDEYKGGSSISKPQVEELPDDVDRPATAPVGKAKSKPKVEELPEEADKPVARTGDRSRRKPAVEEIPDTADRPSRADNRPPFNEPPVTTAPPAPAPAGSLQMANPWVKDAHHNACCGGRTDFIYGLNSASRRDAYPPAEGGNLTVQWNFEGAPQGSISPGEVITITVTGTFTASLPDRDLQTPAGAGVRIQGDIEVVEQKPAYISKTVNQVGKYVLRVRPNAKSATIELAADYNLGVFAIYRFGTEKK